jgi:hypothetical protein
MFGLWKVLWKFVIVGCSVRISWTVAGFLRSAMDAAQTAWASQKGIQMIRERLGRTFLPQGLSRAAVAASLAVGAMMFTGCKSGANAQNSGPDPADANLAPVYAAEQTQQTTPQQPIQNESQQRATEYQQTGQQAGAPAQSQQQQQGYQDQQGYPAQGSQGYPAQADQNYPQQGYPQGAQGYPQGAQGYPQGQQAGQQDQSYDDVNTAVEGLEADQAPPTLPQYDQPQAPGPGYMWTPGYWYWGPAGYYWVPGAWVVAPYQGALWTPGYWFASGNAYRWYPGYWGLHIGFYGGVNYGFGYTGYGYEGGYWRGNQFFYNRAVNNINVTRITNVYNHTVIVNNVSRVSYNGGRGGIQAQPRPTELAAMRERRTPAMAAQVQNRQMAAQNRAQFYSQNRGRPQEMTTARPLAADRGVARPQAGPVRTIEQARPEQSWRPASAPVTRSPAPIVRQDFQQSPQVRPANNRPAPQQQARPQYQPQPQQQYHSEPQPQYRPAPQQQSRPEPQQQPRPEAQPQYRPAPQSSPKPAPQSAPRPAPQSQPRPAPQSQPRPQGGGGGEEHNPHRQ